jgi:chromate transporter
MSGEPDVSAPTLGALAWKFFSIGCVAFGGFMALISVVEDVFVRQLKWIDREDMLDGISLANVLPGPQAVNTVTFVGYRIAGWRGALVSFVGILTPTFVLVTLLTFFYFGVAQELTWLDGFFAGLIPAVAAVIFSVAKRLRAKAVTQPITISLMILAAVALFVTPPALQLRVNLCVLAVAGVAGGIALRPVEALAAPKSTLSVRRVALMVAFPLGLAALYLSNPPLASDGLAHLALTFSGLSVMLFGGGYVFIPMIMDIVVTQEAWLTANEFSDGIAFSQITPGPIMISAAFIGQKVMMASSGALLGIVGGLVCTLAIFGPPALLMVAASEMLDHIRSNRIVQGALRGIRAAVVGMILIAGVVILQTAWPGESMAPLPWLQATAGTWVLFGAALVALIRFELSVLVVIPAAGLLGGLFL